MDSVLGVALTPSTVSLVLVEGHDADGVTVEHEIVEVHADCGERVAGIVARAESAAANQGHRVRAIGVTWTADVDAEATVLLGTLAEAGFDNVVQVRLPQATEALGREIAGVVGYDTTAVCVVEQGVVVAVTVNPELGSIQTSVNYVIDGEGALTDWLGVVFATANRRPEALVLLGPGDDLEPMMPKLQDALDVPVFTPAQAEQPLARGAALAAVGRDRFVPTEKRAATRASRWQEQVRMAPLAVLVGGAVTLVGSLSLAIGLQVSPQEGEPERVSTDPVVNTSEVTVAVPPAPPPAADDPAGPEPLEPEQVAQYVVAPPVSQPAVPVEVPVEVPAEVPTVVADQPVPEASGEPGEVPETPPLPDGGQAPHEVHHQVLPAPQEDPVPVVPEQPVPDQPVMPDQAAAPDPPVMPEQPVVPPDPPAVPEPPTQPMP